MHRQFARSQYRKSIAEAEAAKQREDDADQPQSLCRTVRRLLPDTEGDQFNIVVGVVISMNAVILGFETDQGEARYILFEHFFGVFFTFEMTLRICQLGLIGYLTKGTNSFDCFLVCTGDFDLWIAPLLSNGQDKSGNSIAKLLKLLRMCRVLRIVRLFKMFRELQIILEAFFKALHTVMWVGLLTIILNYICAVFLTQTIGHDAETWGDQAYKIEEWFGSIGHSMRTLFIIITLAEWDEIALVVSEHVNGFFVFTLAIAFITLTAFTMVSLITGIISEELVGAQRDDEDHKLKQIEKGKIDFAANVKTLLDSSDEDGSGSLSHQEIMDAVSDPELKFMERLKALNIAMEMEDFMSLMGRLKEAVRSEDIPIDRIADALMHLSGDASSSSIWDVKMLLLTLQTDGTHNHVGDITGRVSKHKEDISSSSSAMRDKVDIAIDRLRKLEGRFQSEHSRIDSNVMQLMEQVERMEKLQSGKSSGDDVIDRLAKLEKAMTSLCSCMVNGGTASTGGMEPIGSKAPLRPGGARLAEDLPSLL